MTHGGGVYFAGDTSDPRIAELEEALAEARAQRDQFERMFQAVSSREHRLRAHTLEMRSILYDALTLLKSAADKAQEIEGAQ